MRNMNDFRFHVFEAAFVQLVLYREQVRLTQHLVPDELRNHLQLLRALYLDASRLRDGNVDVLANRSQAALDPFRRADNHAKFLRDLARLLWRADVGRRAYLDERDAEPVEPVEHAVPLSPHYLAALLLKADVRYADLAERRLHLPVQPCHSGSLEARGVRAIQNSLPHHVDFFRHLAFEHPGYGQDNIKRLRIHRMRGLLIQLNKAGFFRIDPVDELRSFGHFAERGHIDFAGLARDHAQPAHDLSLRLRFRKASPAAAEELALRVELLVDFDAAFQP